MCARSSAVRSSRAEAFRAVCISWLGPRAHAATSTPCRLKYAGLAEGRSEFQKDLEGCSSDEAKLEVYRVWARTISETAEFRSAKGKSSLDDSMREQAQVAQAALALMPGDECALFGLLPAGDRRAWLCVGPSDALQPGTRWTRQRWPLCGNAVCRVDLVRFMCRELRNLLAAASTETEQALTGTSQEPAARPAADPGSVAGPGGASASGDESVGPKATQPPHARSTDRPAQQSIVSQAADAQVKHAEPAAQHDSDQGQPQHKECAGRATTAAAAPAAAPPSDSEDFVSKQAVASRAASEPPAAPVQPTEDAAPKHEREHISEARQSLAHSAAEPAKAEPRAQQAAAPRGGSRAAAEPQLAAALPAEQKQPEQQAAAPRADAAAAAGTPAAASDVQHAQLKEAKSQPASKPAAAPQLATPAAAPPAEASSDAQPQSATLASRRSRKRVYNAAGLLEPHESVHRQHDHDGKGRLTVCNIEYKLLYRIGRGGSSQVCFILLKARSSCQRTAYANASVAPAPQVFLAVAPNNTLYAIKRCDLRAVKERSLREGFFEEADLLKRLRNKNGIIRLIDVAFNPETQARSAPALSVQFLLCFVCFFLLHVPACRGVERANEGSPSRGAGRAR